jgi:hypothetical protein
VSCRDTNDQVKALISTSWARGRRRGRVGWANLALVNGLAEVERAGVVLSFD